MGVESLIAYMMELEAGEPSMIIMNYYAIA